MPTFKEQGYNVVASIWRGVMVKAGTPKDVVDTLMSAIEKMKKSKEWQVFSRRNMQLLVTISLYFMQKQVREVLLGSCFSSSHRSAETKI